MLAFDFLGLIFEFSPNGSHGGFDGTQVRREEGMGEQRRKREKLVIVKHFT